MDILKAFLIGGLICALVQIVIDKTKLTPARILTALVILGVILGGIGIYERLIEFAGAGASVPLSGFGYLLSKGVRKAIQEKGLIGALTGGFTAASGGIAAALFFSFVASFIARSKEK